MAKARRMMMMMMLMSWSIADAHVRASNLLPRSFPLSDANSYVIKSTEPKARTCAIQSNLLATKVEYFVQKLDILFFIYRPSHIYTHIMPPKLGGIGSGFARPAAPGTAAPSNAAAGPSTGAGAGAGASGTTGGAGAGAPAAPKPKMKFKPILQPTKKVKAE
jgi:hypothetical protein